MAAAERLPGSPAAFLGRKGLSEKYLAILREALTDSKPSLLLDPLRAKFQAKQLAESDIVLWQKVLWRLRECWPHRKSERTSRSGWSLSRR